MLRRSLARTALKLSELIIGPARQLARGAVARGPGARAIAELLTASALVCLAYWLGRLALFLAPSPRLARVQRSRVYSGRASVPSAVTKASSPARRHRMQSRRRSPASQLRRDRKDRESARRIRLGIAGMALRFRSGTALLSWLTAVPRRQGCAPQRTGWRFPIPAAAFLVAITTMQK